MKINALLLTFLLHTANAQEESGHLTSSNGSMDQYFVEDSPSEPEQDKSIETTRTIVDTIKENTLTKDTILTTTHIEETPIAIQTLTSSTETIHTTPTTTLTTHATTTSSATHTTCGTAWEQCGGADYHGPNCCQPGLACVVVNDYWARCIPASTTLRSSSSSGRPTVSSSLLRNGVVSESANFIPVIPWGVIVALLL